MRLGRSAMWRLAFRLVVPSRSALRRSACRFALRLVLASCRLIVSFVVSPAVSPLVSSCIVPSCRLACVGSWGGATLRGVSRRLAIYRHHSCVVIALASSRLSRLVLRCVGRAVLYSVPCRRASLDVSFSHSLRSSPFVVAVGVSWRGVCGEIELTKTARLAFLSHPAHPVACPSCPGR